MPRDREKLSISRKISIADDGLHRLGRIDLENQRLASLTNLKWIVP